MSEEIFEEIEKVEDIQVEQKPVVEHLMFVWLSDEGVFEGSFSKDEALKKLSLGRRVFLLEKELVFKN